MTVSAQAVLLTNGNKAYNNVSVVINACGKNAILYKISTCFFRIDTGSCILIMHNHYDHNYATFYLI